MKKICKELYDTNRKQALTNVSNSHTMHDILGYMDTSRQGFVGVSVITHTMVIAVKYHLILGNIQCHAINSQSIGNYYICIYNHSTIIV